MKTNNKRILSLLLAILMLFSVVPISAVSVDAAGGVKSKLDTFIASYPSGSRWTGTFDGGSQCYGFGKMVIYNIFGKYGSSYRSWTYAGVSTSGMNVIGSITNFSSSNVQNLLSKAKCGDVLQFDYNKQHTMIVYSVDSTGVTVYDCNWDNNCGISKRHSSFGAWSGRNSNKLTLLRASNYSDIDGPVVSHKVDSSYGKNFTAYLKNPSSQTPVYDANHNLVSGRYISGNDPCTIHEVYTDGCCKVSYVTDSGATRTYYTKYSYFKEHVHSYTYQRVYESEHPHRISERCSCGAWRWTNEYKTLNTCEKCWKITWHVSKSSVDIKVGESSRVNVYISDAVVPDGAKVKYKYDDSLIDFSSEKTNSGSDLIFKGRNSGSTNFVIQAWDKDFTKLISSYTIKVTVTSNKHTVTYDANGGSPTFSEPTLEDGTFVFTNRRPEKVGYEFLGWNTVKDAGKPASESILKPGKEMKTSQDITFYAIYEPITYEVALVGNDCDGGNPVKYLYCQYDTSYTLPKNLYTKSGYTFLGWSTNQYSKNPEFKEGQQIKNLLSYKGSVYLFAVWQKNHTHIYNDVKITKQPTCTQSGVKIYTCSCGATKTETIAATGHTVVIDPAVKATCTTSGRTEGSHCSVCGAVIKQQSATAPLGHKYDSGRITTQPNCYQNGVKTYTCTICGTVKTETIAKTSHSYSWKNSGGYIANSCNNCGNEKIRLPFEDLYGYEYYGDYIAYTSVYNKFITGTNPPERTLFSPTAPITRAMFVTILYRMAGEPYANGTPYRTSPFTDIKDTSVYYYDAACWALKNGITTETTFKPFDNVSREQTATFLYRYAQDNDMLGGEDYKNVNLNTYHDGNRISHFAVDAMKWANYNSMITGTEQGYANPQGTTQRIHATKILYGFGKTCNIGKFA